MESTFLKKNTWIPAAALILLAGTSRMIPHPFNFTAIGAMALFSGATFKDKRWAYLMPILTLFITDLFLGFHVSMLPVYACFAFTVAMGTLITSNRNIFRIAGLSLLSSVVFFLVTNLPVWYADLSLYPLTWTGTMESYTMALPYFSNQMLGDLFYNGLLFGIYHLAVSSRKTVTA